ncbi:EpsG family protein [Cognatiluteimonas profundi]|uniref:EpsG family protein n=1 Tax=Cognatiluteimonas profundi TaxID=2594501 RepID=UPI00131E176C|nr:EpsG family protein [Lysobacter profundi]
MSVQLAAFQSPTQVARSTAENAVAAFLLLAVAAFATWLVATRPLEIGTDTKIYADFYAGVMQQPLETRLEPGFVAITLFLKKMGVGLVGYQAALFTLLLATVVVSTREYYRYMGAACRYVTFLGASLMFLLLSPIFVNASINAIRQGLSALLVFTALMAFQRREWWRFLLIGTAASMLHYSALLYIAFAPALFLRPRQLAGVAAIALLLYCSGTTMYLVKSLSPQLYTIVMEYAQNHYFSPGVRVDFAMFSIAWYVLPFALAPMIEAPYRDGIKRSTSVYLVMLLPFFMFGWGYFSNRYLLPAWQAASLMLAAVLCHSRMPLLRSAPVIQCGLIMACGVFYYYISKGIVI